ncbi:MAG: hypothetical protein ACI8ZQ_001848, partial [Bacteroidia bacterium]
MFYRELAKKNQIHRILQIMTRPTTLGELKASGYEPKNIREELKSNLRRR